MKKINPFLWFDSEAEEAAKFYVGIFKNSKIGKITHYGEDGPRPKGSVMTVEFTLDRVEFVALNPESFLGDVGRSRCREGKPRHESDYGNGQDGHRRLRTGREGWLKIGMQSQSLSRH
jgi:hypothetical protein